MTIIVVILFGTGIVLIASALDNSSIVATFQKIMSGQPINWSGSTSSSTTPTSTGGG